MFPYLCANGLTFKRSSGATPALLRVRGFGKIRCVCHFATSASGWLEYRITAFYSGRDSVLGASAGLKHFGMRRLGRTGLANRPPLADPAAPTDNVWDVDCSSFLPREVDGAAIHGAYFINDGTLNLMRQVLHGLDRGVLDSLGYTKGTAWP